MQKNTLLTLALLLGISYSLVYSGDLNGNNLEYNLVEGLPNIYLTPETEKIGHTWVDGMVWDKPLIHEFFSILRENDPFFVAIDLGAQTGSFSLLAKYFPSSQWYAFEPIQEAADVLRTNLILNNIENVVVYQMAASNYSGMAILQMPELNSWGLSTIGSNVLRFNPVAQREVECIDLDSFVAANHIDKVHFMKLDTEGWELNILKGAKNTIMRDRPIMLLEYNETNMKQCNISKEEINDFLLSMGYEWELISTEDILCLPVR